MNPTDKFTRAQGETEALPEALREALSGSTLPGRGAVKKYRSHKTGLDVPQVNFRGLSKTQKTVLSRLAAAAYDLQSKHGLIDSGIKVDAWRQAEAIAAVGVRISEAKQAHYLPLRGHFEALAGKSSVETFQAAVAPEDDIDRQTVAQALREALAGFAQTIGKDGRPVGWHQAESYMLTIANARAKGAKVHLFDTLIATWPVPKIWEMVYTMRNRTVAKNGGGRTAARNVSQRRRK